MCKNYQRSAIRGRVLIVEDDFDVQDLMSTVLTREGYEVWPVQTLREVRAHFPTLWPDVVLLDAHLPDGSGIEALPQIKRRWPEAEVIVATASDLAAEAFRRGASAFLQKPFALDELTRAVNRACRANGWVARGAGAAQAVPVSA